MYTLCIQPNKVK